MYTRSMGQHAPKELRLIKSSWSRLDRELGNDKTYPLKFNALARNAEMIKQLFMRLNDRVLRKRLQVAIRWSPLLRKTAGRCLYKETSAGKRYCIIELSLKVVTSANRLLATLIHELCHAASWILDGERGHGRIWKKWIQRARTIFPDLPPMTVSHNYAIHYKYMLKCCLCDERTGFHSKPRNLSCRKCRANPDNVELLRNVNNKTSNVKMKPIRLA